MRHLLWNMPGWAGLVMCRQRSVDADGGSGGANTRSSHCSSVPPVNCRQHPLGQLSSPLFWTRQIFVNLQSSQILQHFVMQLSIKTFLNRNYVILTITYRTWRNLTTQQIIDNLNFAYVHIIMYKRSKHVGTPRPVMGNMAYCQGKNMHKSWLSKTWCTAASDFW